MSVTNVEFIESLKDVIYAQNTENLKEFLAKLANPDIFIYGAGNAGGMTFELLKNINIDIKGFIDRNASSLKRFMNKQVFMPEDESINEEAYIIISFLCNLEELEAIMSNLTQRGFKNKCYYMDIYNIINLGSFIKIDSHKLEFDRNSFSREHHKILEAAQTFSDGLSREVFLNYFKAIMTTNSDLFSKPHPDIQYFVNDVPFSKGYSRFIDCGAFDGDTAIMLKKIKGKAERIAFFEPDGGNFTKLNENLAADSVADQEILFPCGVWKQSEMMKFKSGNRNACSISDYGDVYIQCISIDEALRGFAPTFIKMDIEGAELEALLGAKNTIKRYAPDLAISVYHRFGHMWDIPLLIKEFNPNYKFYLRSHGLHGMETILYAVCDE